MEDNFVQEVQQIVGPLLLSMGFDLYAIDADVDEGGPKGSVVFYRAAACKVQIYRSSREGEINAMIGPRDAPDVHGLYDRSRKWHYFNDFDDSPKLPLEELVQKLQDERANFESTQTWLQWIKRERICRYFESARDAIIAGQ
ncbi:hypothetical protein [Mycobacterium intracellulare]|uniref:hypothetical protein n=1 Tax=Mycobacterium intracellulare TaxID=1767 RepID=UPI001916A6CD|nr:hypothetical protein [Mycobacterium intracellulare]BCO48221.1 hypothetical protein MINTM002_38950 [Mycobacterium intracellulare]BCO69316.1 hypothetical protein MINTM007_39270 [Mycobacterium intracellulare]